MGTCRQSGGCHRPGPACIGRCGTDLRRAVIHHYRAVRLGIPGCHHVIVAINSIAGDRRRRRRLGIDSDRQCSRRHAGLAGRVGRGRRQRVLRVTQDLGDVIPAAGRSRSSRTNLGRAVIDLNDAACGSGPVQVDLVGVGDAVASLARIG